MKNTKQIVEPKASVPRLNKKVMQEEPNLVYLEVVVIFIKQSPNYQNRSQFSLFLDTNTLDPTIHLTNNWNMTKILAKYLRYMTNQPEKQMPLQCSMILIILCVNITKSARMNQIVKWLKHLVLYPIMKDSGDSFWPVIW